MLAFEVFNRFSHEFWVVLQHAQRHVAVRAKDASDGPGRVRMVDVPLAFGRSKADFFFLAEGALPVLRFEHGVELVEGESIDALAPVPTLMVRVEKPEVGCIAKVRAVPGMGPASRNILAAVQAVDHFSCRSYSRPFIAAALVLARTTPSSLQKKLTGRKGRGGKILSTTGTSKQFHVRNYNMGVL